MQSLSFKCPKCNCNNIHYKSEKCMCLKHNTMSNTKYVNYKCFKCKYSENITDEMNCETGEFYIITCPVCLNEKDIELFFTDLKTKTCIVTDLDDEFKNIVLLSYDNAECRCLKLPYYGNIKTQEVYLRNTYNSIPYFTKIQELSVSTIEGHHLYFFNNN